MPYEARTRLKAPRSDEVLAMLEDEIVDGRLPPGQRISETEVAARLGVGRAPVREAFRTLESRRLLQRVPYAGMRVVALAEKDVRELLALRSALEGLAAREAAAGITDEGAEILRSALSTEEQLAEEGVGAVFRRGSGDNGFHETIVRLADNAWLESMLLTDLYSLLRTFRFRAAQGGGRLSKAHREHCAIAEAIISGDARDAEELMRNHIEASLKNLIAN